MKQSDRRMTPDWLIALVRDFFDGCIPFDACTETSNPLGASWWCDGVDFDGLVYPWASHLGTWCNPPFSNMRVWVDKAIDEARRGNEILFLSRADNRTKWFRALADNADGRCLLHRSVAFSEVRDDGSLKKLSGDFYAYSVWHFGRQRRRFDRVFSSAGEIIPGRGPVEVFETLVEEVAQ